MLTAIAVLTGSIVLHASYMMTETRRAKHEHGKVFSSDREIRQ